jgi:hypothetical protein
MNAGNDEAEVYEEFGSSYIGSECFTGKRKRGQQG